MSNTRLRLAPGLGELASLGANSIEDLFEPRRLITGARARALLESRQESLWRVPLPGMPDERGRMPELPRGAGTGWLWIRTFRSRNAALLEARCTHPRSTSLAAREWNLVCHLEAAGVGAPRLLALAERGNLLAAEESCLVTAELAGFEPLDGWLGRTRDPDRRRRALESVGRMLGRVFRSRTWLPNLALEDLWIESAAGETPQANDCAALEIQRLRELRAARVELRDAGLRVRPLPAVACVRFSRGRILARVSGQRSRSLLVKLGREGLSRFAASDRELIRVCLRAGERDLPHAQTPRARGR